MYLRCVLLCALVLSLVVAGCGSESGTNVNRSKTVESAASKSGVTPVLGPNNAAGVNSGQNDDRDQQAVREPTTRAMRLFCNSYYVDGLTGVDGGTSGPIVLEGVIGFNNNMVLMDRGGELLDPEGTPINKVEQFNMRQLRDVGPQARIDADLTDSDLEAIMNSKYMTYVRVDSDLDRNTGEETKTEAEVPADTIVDEQQVDSVSGEPTGDRTVYSSRIDCTRFR